MRARLLAIVVGTAGCGRDAAPAKAAPHPVDVAVTDANTAVVMNDGAVLVWGHARRGAVGWLDRRDVAVPVRAAVPPATEVVGGGFERTSTLCARAGADWWCWGDRLRLPIGGVVRWERFAAERDRVLAPVRIEGFAGIKVLRLNGLGGSPGAGCAIRADDSLVCWRQDWSEAFPAPGPVIDVALGLRHACALARDGRVWCWGDQTYGAVDGVPVPEVAVAFAPVVVAGVDGATAIAVGQDVTCARLAGDQLACWGATFYGSGVVRFAGVPGAALFAGGNDICERAPDGKVRCLAHAPAYWCPTGIDVAGKPCQKGVTGHPADAPPVRWIDAPPVKRIAWGRQHACAIAMDDTLACSGRNDHGELGDGTLVDHTTGAPVTGLATPATAPPEPVAAERARRAMRWDQAPPGCEHDPALAGVPGPMPIASAWAAADASLISLRSYASSISDDDLRGGQRELKIDLTLPAGFTTGTVALATSYQVVGSGPPAARDEPTAIAVLRASDGDLAWFGNNPGAGSLTIAVHDARWVCGTIDAAGDGATIKGKFAAEVVP